MNLKKIFGSGARVKIFRQFLLNPEGSFFIRELTRLLDEQINSLRRELDNLEKMGMLKSKEKNRKKYYHLNPHFSLLPELTSIIRKTDDQNAEILKKLMKVGDIDVLILSGFFCGQPEGEIDLFCVGDIEKQAVESFLMAQYPEEDLKYAVMTREDFLYRIALKDNFVQNVFQISQNIVLKNKLKKDTESLLVV